MVPSFLVTWWKLLGSCCWEKAVGGFQQARGILTRAALSRSILLQGERKGETPVWTLGEAGTLLRTAEMKRGKDPSISSPGQCRALLSKCPPRPVLTLALLSISYWLAQGPRFPMG